MQLQQRILGLNPHNTRQVLLLLVRSTQTHLLKMCQIYYKRFVLCINTEMGISLARAAWDFSLDRWVNFVEKVKSVIHAV